VSIQEITDMADVGFGSFYNHFESKADLFDTALEEVLEEHGAMFDALTADMDDPAEVFASATRMTVRMVMTHPQIAKILQRTGSAISSHGTASAPARCATCNEPRTPAASASTIRRWPCPAPVGRRSACFRCSPWQSQAEGYRRRGRQLVTYQLRMFGLPDEEAREIALPAAAQAIERPTTPQTRTRGRYPRATAPVAGSNCYKPSVLMQLLDIHTS
jgi:AcrR family transcriptional regulator